MTDWLDEPAPEEKVGLPAVVALPDSYAARAALAEACWQRLSPRQKTFLAAWRDCRFNERAACRQLGLSENTKPNTGWMQEPDYAMVARIWRANVAAAALDRDRLLARQDDIVETLLTPKPILRHGFAVFDPRHPGKILEEVEAGAASRANETLMRVAGMFPKEGTDVAIGVQIPAITVELSPAKGETVEGQAVVEVDPSVPS